MFQQLGWTRPLRGEAEEENRGAGDPLAAFFCPTDADLWLGGGCELVRQLRLTGCFPDTLLPGGTGRT